MPDRPSPEQQLAEVIALPAIFFVEEVEHANDYWNRQAAAIVAAVNNGDIDPILPDKGAWLTSIPAAELAELRALKAKVDGCLASRGLVCRPEAAALGHGWLYATDLLAWLRGDS